MFSLMFLGLILAQVIKKRKIVIASVLKPVDDTRMFEKIGQTLADSESWEVHIIGYQSRKEHRVNDIFFHAQAPFSRLSLYRISVPWRTTRKILQLEPEVVIITTHELLVAGIFIRLFSKARLIYDVQENYFRNILYMKTFPALIRPMLAGYVRLKELVFAPFVNHFFLSEAGYRNELPFLQNRFTVLENKVKKKAYVTRKETDKKTQLLFSGTLAESTGVFVAINLANQLHKIDPGMRLKIIGYCAMKETLDEIHQAIAGSNHIELIGGDQLVPHDEIMRAIHESDAGIISYLPNKSTSNRIPTKLFEYIGNQLPILMTGYEPWVTLCAPYPAAILFDPDHTNTDELLRELETKKFYNTPPAEDVYWETEGKKLMSTVSFLCKA